MEGHRGYYRETGVIEVATELLDNIDDRMYSFEEEQEFDDYFNSYLSEGWLCEFGVKPNTRYISKNDESGNTPNKPL